MIVNNIDRDYIIHDEFNIKGFFGSYRWLSNFHESPVYYNGILFLSSENAYQSAKCKNSDDIIKYLGISPSQSKKISKTIESVDNWHDIKYDIMSSIVFDKFYRDLELRHLLLSTGNKYLEETNHWNDIYWGVCNGVGQNKLGLILMKVRDFWSIKDNGIF